MSGTVLVVEDEPEIVDLLREVLSEHGYTVVSALGREALNYAVEHQPAAILLDMMLPQLPGSSILGYLHSEPATGHIPVIVMTAAPVRDETSNLLGAFALIRKPFRLEQLLTVVDRAVGKE